MFAPNDKTGPCDEGKGTFSMVKLPHLWIDPTAENEMRDELYRRHIPLSDQSIINEVSFCLSGEVRLLIEELYRVPLRELAAGLLLGEHAGVRRPPCIVCATARSGSTYYGTLLAQLDQVGRPHEIFHHEIFFFFSQCLRAGSLSDYLRRMASLKLGGGVFGFKVDHPNFMVLANSFYFVQETQRASYIYITRSDLAAAAVSFHVATTTGRFMSPGVPIAAPVYDFGSICTYFEAIKSQQAVWERVFFDLGVIPLRVDYDELSADPAHEMARACSFLGLPSSEAARDLKPLLGVLRTPETEAMVERFRVDLKKNGSSST